MPQLTHNGVTLHYELEGTGSNAVYICGFSSHSNDGIAQMMRQALSQNHRLLTVDNRGSGQTVVGDKATVTLEDMADDVAAVIAHHQMAPAHIIGQSMGSDIAMMLALRHPDKVLSLVLAVPGYINSPRSLFAIKTWRQMLDQGVSGEVIGAYFAILVLGDDMFRNDAFMQMWLNGPADPLAQTQQGFLQQFGAVSRYTVPDNLHTIKAPILVVSSPDDVLSPPDRVNEVSSLMPNAQNKHYPGGHLFFLLPPAGPQFIQDVLAFWEGIQVRP